MADFSALKTSIQNYIKQNGNEEITGNLLQQVLLSMVTTLGDSAINDLVTALNAEIANRGNADTTLQGNINSEATTRANADTELGGRITTLQGVVNGIKANVENGYVYAGIATPSSTPASGKVFYLALTAGTYTNFGATVVQQGINILKYNGSAWSLDSFLGLDDAPTQGSGHLVKSGGVLDSIIKDGSAFDLSAYNNGTTYADLSAALTALNALPAVYKKGGMSVKYVQTSDNKYVQYRLMADAWSTVVTDWQGIDDEPTPDSDNMVKSGGVYNDYRENNENIAHFIGEKLSVRGNLSDYVSRLAANNIFTHIIDFPFSLTAKGIEIFAIDAGDVQVYKVAKDKSFTPTLLKNISVNAGSKTILFDTDVQIDNNILIGVCSSVLGYKGIEKPNYIKGYLQFTSVSSSNYQEFHNQYVIGYNILVEQYNRVEEIAGQINTLTTEIDNISDDVEDIQNELIEEDKSINVIGDLSSYSSPLSASGLFVHELNISDSINCSGIKIYALNNGTVNIYKVAKDKSFAPVLLKSVSVATGEQTILLDNSVLIDNNILIGVNSNVVGYKNTSKPSSIIGYLEFSSVSGTGYTEYQNQYAIGYDIVAEQQSKIVVLENEVDEINTQIEQINEKVSNVVYSIPYAFCFNKILFVGDSVTAGWIVDTNFNSATKGVPASLSYPSRIHQVCPTVNCVNLGFPGESIAGYNQNRFNSIVANKEGVDLVVIELGWNPGGMEWPAISDFDGLFATGVISHGDDYANYDTTTVYGNYAQLIKKIQNEIPDTALVLVASMGWSSSYYERMIYGIGKIALWAGAKYLDLHNYPVDAEDNIHFTALGYMYKANVFLFELRKLMLNNKIYFNNKMYDNL